MVKILEGKFEEKNGVIFSDLLKRERAKLGFDKNTTELIKIAKKVHVLKDDSTPASDYVNKDNKRREEYSR